MEQSTNDFDVLTFLLQRFVTMLASSGICARVKHGTIEFEFTINNGVVTRSMPRVELSIRTETTK